MSAGPCSAGYQNRRLHIHRRLKTNVRLFCFPHGRLRTRLMISRASSVDKSIRDAMQIRMMQERSRGATASSSRITHAPLLLGTISTCICISGQRRGASWLAFNPTFATVPRIVKLGIQYRISPSYTQLNCEVSHSVQRIIAYTDQGGLSTVTITIVRWQVRFRV